MDTSEKRIIGSLILLAGLTFLSIALYTNQLTKVAELMKSIFGPAVAGMP
ncbi:MAG: hypothetical protein OEY24_08510 [Candidatus Bathyarchaeota archaeon]|nr:hypothetical protein [Candidatus Bathyarchaeota archaeon]MDH5495723.1 hypothetical protein [Candidatus Bathyarchaeota archaeon]